jgi:hypothetical protein
MAYLVKHRLTAEKSKLEEPSSLLTSIKENGFCSLRADTNLPFVG